MKKQFATIFVIVVSLALASCGGGKESASSIANKWCDLNGKAHKAAEGTEKEAAEATLDKFEKDMEAKYKGDTAFMAEVEKEVNKCEDASEGR
jgi:hypothetical protein